MHFDRGSLVVGKIRGIPIRLHWSIPVMMIFFSRFQFEPVFWLVMLFVILVHELGHAYQIRRFGLTVTEVELHGMGGHCAWYGRATPLQRSWIASGGVIAQLVLFVVAAAVLGFEPRYGTMWGVQEGLIWTNAYMAAFNLIPYPPMDGVEAWKLPRMLMARRARKVQAAEKKHAASARRQAEQALQDRDARAEEGITDALKAKTDSLLAEALSASPTDED